MNNPNPWTTIRLRISELHATIDRLEGILKRTHEAKVTRIPKMRIEAHDRAAHWRTTYSRRK